MIAIASKVFALILAITVISRAISDYRSKKESFQMTAFWIFVWLAILAVAMFPSIIEYAINALGGTRTGLGTIIGMAIIFILFISYRVYVKAHRIEKQVAKIARKMALEGVEKE